MLDRPCRTTRRKVSLMSAPELIMQKVARTSGTSDIGTWFGLAASGFTMAIGSVERIEIGLRIAGAFTALIIAGAVAVVKIVDAWRSVRDRKLRNRELVEANHKAKEDSRT
jgi:hypothetical protein